MKYILFFCMLFICCVSAFAQDDDPWTMFWNADSSMVGYQDATGKVRLEPSEEFFSGFLAFEHIIPMKGTSPDYHYYYLTRTGKKCAIDSVYVFDASPACEQEGFILFSEPKNRMVGLLNRDGNVVIPAMYNAMTSVNNGMLLALKGAHKKMWDNDGHGDCNHFSWEGGTEQLIDTAGHVLIDNFPYDQRLSLHTLQITDKPLTDAIRKSFKGRNGRYYSFIDVEKEYMGWLRHALGPDANKQSLLQATYKSISSYTDDGLRATPGAAFIERNAMVMLKALKTIYKPGCTYSLAHENLYQFMDDDQDSKRYFNNCGESRQDQYPLMSLVISHQGKDGLEQDHFGFLRTPDGYRLFAVALRSAALK